MSNHYVSTDNLDFYLLLITACLFLQTKECRSMAPFDDKGVEIESQIVPPEQQQPPVDVAPPVGITPPQVLAQDAAAGRRGAAWRLLHWIMEDDPRAVLAVSSCEDDRL